MAAGSLSRLVPGIRETLEAEAEKLANQWLTRFRVDIKNLSDERQDVYRQIRLRTAVQNWSTVAAG